MSIALVLLTYWVRGQVRVTDQDTVTVGARDTAGTEASPIGYHEFPKDQKGQLRLEIDELKEKLNIP